MITLKKVILIAFASICLSFIFINNGFAQNTPLDFSIPKNGDIYKTTLYSNKSIVAAAEEKKNAVCDVHNMRKRYQESCYSCLVVKTLTETFMRACSKVYPMSREAGSKIAIIGAVIWLVIFALKNVSSFTSLEPANNVGDLLNFLFKVLFALVFINAGIGALIHYIVEPILIAGADYGMGVVASATGFEAPTSEYKYDGVELISTESINKLFGLNQAIDKTVSENLVIGNAIICHSMNAGAWVDASFLWILTLKIPNLWLMFCGAAIWFAGFMLTLSISFYVLDVSFKLGFALILLPLAIGLWPFEVTKDKLPAVLSIIFKSAAIFAFLAITTSYALNMISTAMRDINEFYVRIENDDATWISETFEITGSYFIIIIFAYLYSIKMIGGTINNYVNKFFSDNVFKDKSPIHDKSTQATDIAKQKSLELGKGAVQLGGKAAWAGAKGLVRGARGDETGGTTIVGNTRKAVGRFAQFTGRNAAKIGNFNRKVSQDLQNFSNKHIQKGVDNKNIFSLAAGNLANKLSDKRLPGEGVSTSLANKLQNWGEKQEEKGRDFNAKYRGVKTNVKNSINDELDLAKSALNQGKDFVKDMAKDAALSAKDDLNTIGKAAQNTKVFQGASKIAHKVGDVANVAGTKLSNGYTAATTGTKGFVRGVQTKTNQVASEYGNKAKELGKRTWVYRGGKYVGEKTAQGAAFVGDKAVQGAQFVKGGTIEIAESMKEAVVESTVYKAGETVVNGAKTLDRSVRDGAIGFRSGVGEIVGAGREFAQDVKSDITGGIKGQWQRLNDKRKETGRALNTGLYNKLSGEKIASKYRDIKEDIKEGIKTDAPNFDNKTETVDNKAVEKEYDFRKEEKERQEKERKEKAQKEANAKAERDKKNKEAKEKRKKEEDERRKAENDRIALEQENKNRFEQEYKDLLKKFNITDISSVDDLSDERKLSLKNEIERLKSIYKQ